MKPRFAKLKWIVGGAAAATLVTGIVLLAVDGSPSCSASGASCPRLYSTAAGGAVLTILGVAGASAAGYMFWHDRQHREASAAVAPTAGGAAAALRMSF